MTKIKSINQNQLYIAQNGEVSLNIVVLRFRVYKLFEQDIVLRFTWILAIVTSFLI